MEDIERTLLVKPEVFIYKIPPRPSARGYRAADWNLSNPDWTGRMRILVRGKKCEIKLEDKLSGELFACCPVEVYPGTSVEPVTDSSRYFVLCIQDSGRKAYIGIGFADRSDSFDLNVALQDHFKWVKKEDAFSKEAAQPPAPNLDLAFKEGQTIRINIPNKNTGNSDAVTKKSNNRSNLGLATGAIPPPPSSGLGKIAPPPGSANLTPLQSPSDSKPVIGQQPQSNVDLLGDFLSGGPSNPVQTGDNNLIKNSEPFDDPWGDFTSATVAPKNASGNWEKF